MITAQWNNSDEVGNHRNQVVKNYCIYTYDGPKSTVKNLKNYHRTDFIYVSFMFSRITNQKIGEL